MNPRFKWLALGCGALGLLLIFLILFVSCRAVGSAEDRAEALASQLAQSLQATPPPTPTPLPTASPLVPELPTAVPVSSPSATPPSATAYGRTDCNAQAHSLCFRHESAPSLTQRNF